MEVEVRVVAIVSGGIDSFVAAAAVQSLGHDVDAISFFYGQRHSVELDRADELLAGDLGIPVHRIDISSAFKWDMSSLRLGGVPAEHHSSTVAAQINSVANRNMIFIAVAAGLAVSTGATGVVIGAHAGGQQPDGKKPFIEAMRATLHLSSFKRIELVTPLMDMSKTDVVRLGHSRALRLSRAWSCYIGGPVHCGKCGTCTERREAFAAAGVVDETEYQA